MVLLEYGHKRCDARCYNAKSKVCKCICKGENHGVGEQEAFTRSMLKSLEEIADGSNEGC